MQQRNINLTGLAQIWLKQFVVAAWFITETGNWVRFEEQQSEVIEEEDNVWDELADAEDNLSDDTVDTSEIDELESKKQPFIFAFSL